MGQELGLQGLAHPRGVRRPGLHVRRARHRARGDGPRAAVRAVLLDASCSPRTRSSTPAPTTQKAALLPGIASGETIATLAFTEPNGKWDAAGITMEAPTPTATASRCSTARRCSCSTATPPTSSSWSPRLAGTTRHRRHLVLHRRRRRRRASPAPRSRRWTRPASRPSSSSRRGGAAARRAGCRLARAVSKTLDQAAVALANEMVGGAQFVLDMSVEYAKDRVQFGRPIGSFQAIKHKCADMLLEVESAKSAAYYAAWAAAEDNDELPVVAALAKAYCSDAYFHATAENIQIHGGIGFTWEHDAHLYFKRAKSRRSSSATPPTTASCSRSASASESLAELTSSPPTSTGDTATGAPIDARPVSRRARSRLRRRCARAPGVVPPRHRHGMLDELDAEGIRSRRCAYALRVVALVAVGPGWRPPPDVVARGRVAAAGARLARAADGQGVPRSDGRAHGAALESMPAGTASTRRATRRSKLYFAGPLTHLRTSARSCRPRRAAIVAGDFNLWGPAVVPCCGASGERCAAARTPRTGRTARSTTSS